jgi:hypothetical protein
VGLAWEDAFLSSLPGSCTRRLSWGFQRSPLHRTGLATSTPAWSARISPGLPCIGSPLPKDESRSVFVVSHHLDGFLRHASRGFVAPRSRSWGSPRSGFDLTDAETSTRTPPSATHHPSKHLHARSDPPCLHGSPGFLPSCRSPPKRSRLQGFGPREGSRGIQRIAATDPVQLPWVSSSLPSWTSRIPAIRLPREALTTPGANRADPRRKPAGVGNRGPSSTFLLLTEGQGPISVRTRAPGSPGTLVVAVPGPPWWGFDVVRGTGRRVLSNRLVPLPWERRGGRPRR